jgi:hypothetical protein
MIYFSWSILSSFPVDVKHIQDPECIDSDGVRVLRDLLRPALGSRLMLTCRAMLFWILL